MSKKILHLAPYFWPEEIGSAPYCTELAVWLEEQGHHVSVLAFRPHYPKIEGFDAWSDGSRDEEKLGRIKVSRVPVTERGSGGLKQRLVNDLRFLLAALSRAIRGSFHGTDIVVAYTPTILTLFGAMLVRAVTGCRVVAIVHDIESGLARFLGLVSNKAFLSLITFFEKVALNSADQVIVLSEGMRSELERIGCRRPISVISLWAPEFPDAPVAKQAPPLLMYSGNFGKKQNLEQLLPLIKRLSIEQPSIRVVMQGDGSERNKIEELFSTAGITNTAFLPVAPASEFFSSLQAASVHLVPQALNVANYALPSKIFSIMSVGRPFVCIAEKDSPLDRLAQLSGAGVCVAPGDEDQLFRTIIALIQNADEIEVRGRKGREFVKSFMNKLTIMKRYHSILLEGGIENESPARFVDEIT